MSEAMLSRDIQSFVVSSKQMELDHQMVPFDIWGTRAHVLMLESTSIIDRKKARAILSALNDIERSYEHGSFKIDSDLGAQLTLEQEIVTRAGEEAGLSTHTARSRNDQVMVTEMLYLKSRSFSLCLTLNESLRALLALGKPHIRTVMPGYTHMQPGKPTTFAHWCLAYFDSMKRAGTALMQAVNRYNASPLGSVESFGTSWPIDRELTSKLLGFEAVWEVPQDAISSRGFMQLELLGALNLIAIVGSKIAADLLLYTTFEFQFVALGDKVAKRLHPITGSSVMPQKRNPDALELVRATGTQVSAAYTAVSGILAGLPTGYNRDSREIKEYIQAAFDKVKTMLEALCSVFGSLQVNAERMRKVVDDNYSLATELADALAQRFNLPYRKVYKALGQAVDEAIGSGKSLLQLTPADIARNAQLRGLNMDISAEELQGILCPVAALERRRHIGGTNGGVTSCMFKNRERILAEFSESIDSQRIGFTAARERATALADKIIAV